MIFYLTLLQIQEILGTKYDWDHLNLPDNHIPYYFYRNLKIKKNCAEDDQCPYKKHVNSTKCYGYEEKCKASIRVNMTECPGDIKSAYFQPF